jgi:hypothetical protein
MSELFHVEVTAVDGPLARVRFSIVHPDQHEVPVTENFALQVLTELYWLEREGYLSGVAEAQSIAAASPRRDDLEKWLELAHGKRHFITQVEYQDLSDHLISTEGLSAWGMDNGRYYKQERTEYEAFRGVAARVIREVHLEDAHHHPRVSEDAPDPYATLVFTVDDAALLAHLRPGMTWDSAMYDFEGW